MHGRGLSAGSWLYAGRLPAVMREIFVTGGDSESHTLFLAGLVFLLPPGSCRARPPRLVGLLRRGCFAACVSFRHSLREGSQQLYCPLTPRAQEEPSCHSVTENEGRRSQPCSPAAVPPSCWFRTRPRVGPKVLETKHTSVCLLPAAAVTNDHKLSSLR